MKLYYADVLMPRKACALAHYLEAPVEFVYLDLAKGEHKTPDYLKLNPNGKVPTLADDAHSIWEADAILCRLAQIAKSDTWPDDNRQAEILRWLSWNAYQFNPGGSALYFEYVIKPRFNIGPPDDAEVKAAQATFRTYGAILDNHLKGRKWLLGDTLSIADFSVAVTLPYAEKAHIPLNEFPQMKRWHDQLNEFDGWRNPFPRTHDR